MQGDAMNSTANVESDYIWVGSTLLRQLMSELKRLEAHNARLALAMASVGHDLRQRLQVLIGLVERLAVADNATQVSELKGQARAQMPGIGIIHRTTDGGGAGP